VVDGERKVGGRSFQTRGPETAKLLRDPHFRPSTLISMHFG